MERKRKGLCVIGGCTNKSISMEVRCEECKKIQNERAKRYREKKEVWERLSKIK